MKIAVILFAALAMSACSVSPPKYVTSPEIGAALKSLPGNIGVGSISAPEDFSSWCRGGPFVGQQITPPDWNLSFEGYIQNALVEELKAAGKHGEQTAKVTLSGTVEKLYFSTTTHGLSGGVWDITLRLTSSNGKSALVSEHYEFDTSSMGPLACSQAKDAYHPAVQNLIRKLARSANFKSLLVSKK